MAARKRTVNDEPAPNGPADLGWGKEAVSEPKPDPRSPRKIPPGPPPGTRQTNVVPDPGITHGHFRVLQRVDGPFVVLDTRRDPGDQTIAIHRQAPKREKDAPDAKKIAEEDAKARHAADPKEDPTP